MLHISLSNCETQKLSRRRRKRWKRKKRRRARSLFDHTTTFWPTPNQSGTVATKTTPHSSLTSLCVPHHKFVWSIQASVFHCKWNSQHAIYFHVACLTSLIQFVFPIKSVWLIQTIKAAYWLSCRWIERPDTCKLAAGAFVGVGWRDYVRNFFDCVMQTADIALHMMACGGWVEHWEY